MIVIPSILLDRMMRNHTLRMIANRGPADFSLNHLPARCRQAAVFPACDSPGHGRFRYDRRGRPVFPLVFDVNFDGPSEDDGVFAHVGVHQFFEGKRQASVTHEGFEQPKSVGVLTRYLTYHQHLGDRQTARKQFADLPAEAKDWAGADLAAAKEACPNKLDFAALLPKVDEFLA